MLTSLMNKGSGYMNNPLRQNFFRVGHAHAGVIVILSLVCEMLADSLFSRNIHYFQRCVADGLVAVGFG
ncbi:MAG: hypothetical protein JO249_17780 [Acidobacteria bacterium]|nr:hypothetical protein [Acidobacteriota bacterium]